MYFHILDTQEAPKTIGLEPSSSCESLNDDDPSEDRDCERSSTHFASSSQQRSISPVGTVKSLNMSVVRPPIPVRRAPFLGSGGSAFISYVRKRGEPDGGRPDNEPPPPPVVNMLNSHRTDSDSSDFYQPTGVNLMDYRHRLSYSNMPTLKIGRPGGGGESDATFTPSPPVPQSTENPNVSLALAHQTRIRTLYSGNSKGKSNTSDDITVHSGFRPDSSSSTSSATDWEISGHATVLRRSNQGQINMPPLPPPRPNGHGLENVTEFNKIGMKRLPKSTISGGNIIESSSESEFEKGMENQFTSSPAVAQTQSAGGRTKPSRLKVLQQHLLPRKLAEQFSFMDRLSVRTEINGGGHSKSSTHKQMETIPDEETTLSHGMNNLYVNPPDMDGIQPPPDVAKTKSTTKTNSKEHKVKTSKHKQHQDTILMRHLNLQMKPSISDVYHERNLGLDLAPSLSKLLLTKNYDNETAANNKSNSNEYITEVDMNCGSGASSGMHLIDRCNKCKGQPDILCSCRQGTVSSGSSTGSGSNSGFTKKSKPWITNITSNLIQTTELTTSDFLEGKGKMKRVSEGGQTLAHKRNSALSGSPFTDMSRRDEGDGRSVADSQCSGTYKTAADIAAATNAAKTRNLTGTTN